ncbi:MAG: hypothetical protein VYA34_12800 [Myxococcota bacterium]|nr:hypothetical protein [Myxococcota bacterium]
MSEEIQIDEYTLETVKPFIDEIRELHRNHVYEIGSEHQICFDMGTKLDAWLSSVGTPRIFVARLRGEIVATSFAIERELISSNGKNTEPFWYLCNFRFKTHINPSEVSRALFEKYYRYYYFRCPRLFTVMLDPTPQVLSPPPDYLSSIGSIRFKAACQIGIICLDTELMEEVDPILRRHRGPIYYHSSDGIRDIQDAQNKQPLPLLHAQFGPCSQRGYADPVDDHLHVFCTPLSDPLLSVLKYRGIQPIGTMTVFHHQMHQWNWQFLLTNEL